MCAFCQCECRAEVDVACLSWICPRMGIQDVAFWPEDWWRRTKSLRDSFNLAHSRTALILLSVLVLSTVAFYGAFIRPGVGWADDWATYIQDALNILHGRRYSTTGYIFYPDANIGPTAFPPLFPLTLVIPFALWGVDFDAIREFQLLFWA